MILGIDPGVSGACCLLDPKAAAALRWKVADVPIVGDPKELNALALRDWILRHRPSHAFLELVNAMPVIGNRATGVRRGMGATSAFRFGGMFFAIKAVLACCDVPYTLVPPAKWKAASGLKGPDKEASRRRALQLFPELSAALARKMDQNRAEAALIARYGSVMLGAMPELALAAAE